MKIVDAVWENKNLRKKTVEITIEVSDNEAEIKSQIIEIIDNYEYIVVKTPTGNIDINKYLNIKGFYFAENQLSLRRNLKQKFLNQKMLDYIEKKITAIKITDTKQLHCDIFKQIDSSMFSTDRIYLDSSFEKGSSERRYKNWIETTFYKNELYKLIYNDKIIGFTYGSYDNNVYHGLLGGIFSPYKGLGLGISIIQKPIYEAIKRNIKYFETKISSNNPNVLNLYQNLDFKIYTIENVFVKINN